MQELEYILPQEEWNLGSKVELLPKGIAILVGYRQEVAYPMVQLELCQYIFLKGSLFNTNLFDLYLCILV
jgi:hypothetical protein